MKDEPAISITNVDELHAHFAEWVKFLRAKGEELEAQLAKLEAKKVKTGTAQVKSDSITHSKDAADQIGFLNIAFDADASSPEVEQHLTPSEMPSPDISQSEAHGPINEIRINHPNDAEEKASKLSDPATEPTESGPEGMKETRKTVPKVDLV